MHKCTAALGVIPVMARFDDNAQIGFEMERTQQGTVVVYLPGAPAPWSGAVMYVDPGRIEQLDLSVSEAVRIIRQLGRGSALYYQPTALKSMSNDMEIRDANT